MRTYLYLCSLAILMSACALGQPQPTEQAPTLEATATAVNVAPQSVEKTATPTPTSTPPTPTVSLPAEVTVEVPGVVLPPGFSLLQYADFYRPTSLAFDAGGRLYATSFDGTLHVLNNSDGDGRADADTLLAGGFDTPLGVTVHAETGDVYVSSLGQIDRLPASGDGFDDPVPFVENLPTGRHQNDNLKFGPDGLLYIGIGSTCDVCVEADPRSATIMRFDVDTAEGEVIASGLRNPYDIAFHPESGALFATDNGRDDLGDTAPSEELNHVLPGRHYGWPGCWDELEGTGCEGTEQAVVLFQARSSVNSLDFYTGDAFPEEYHDDLFVAVFGSFLVDVERGIWRVQLTPEGDTYAGEAEWFAQWPDGWLLGLVVGPDGALYVGDYINSGIYRISYGS